MVPAGMEYKFAATLVLDTTLEFEDGLAKLLQEVGGLGLHVTDVVAGAETGVELTDALSEKLGLRTNGTKLSEARRNKYVMGETVRGAGLRAAKQLRSASWLDIDAFLKDWQPDPFKVIVKPMDSAGSDDVTLCRSLAEVQAAFGNIIGKVNGLGIVNKELLVQEYLEGDEYVIDMVSRDGVHKVVAIWLYDRRPANGASFVCFGQRALMADEPRMREIIEYQKKVVTALGIRNGPTHGEVKWFQNEPVLVEVGARCHGGDGLWVNACDEVYGFNQVGHSHEPAKLC
jgi:biotin carboxylase